MDDVRIPEANGILRCGHSLPLPRLTSGEKQKDNKKTHSVEDKREKEQKQQQKQCYAHGREKKRVRKRKRRLEEGRKEH